MSNDDNQTLLSLIGAYDNFDEPVPVWNNKATILGIVITFLVVSVICILFRLYTRLFIVKSPGWDDVFVFLFMLSGGTGSVFTCLMTQYGLGKHFILLTDYEIDRYLTSFYIANATYSMSTMLMKLSLLFQYLRIFKQGTFLRRFTIVMIVVIALWGAAFSFISWVPCFPIAGYWDLTISAKCYGYGSPYAKEFAQTFETHAGMNMIFDIIVLGIPISIYFEKGSSAGTRMRLLGLFAMGTVVNIFGIFRLVTIVEHRASSFPTFDPTWYAPVSVVQACLEVDAASICASMPVFWPILSASYDKIFVTREVTITHSHRRLSESGESNEYGDNVELQPRNSGQDSEVTRGSTVHSQKSEKNAHYMDSYILEQVDPLRAERRAGVEASITAERQLKKKSSLFLGHVSSR
ncbi:uncharacterized protein BCR38DRAFT_520903 [Pseudomassariella vexata]|uniref:Rhodopsin domain-containing protein n=1 Tax=Pseudomassariella vexata TaxID=1141098 RepID=A0A1Y2EEQ6_9PEZI|nr:uncharacterized protein BCR38DRAFT_520903 [Pseudomassariella vexata]ORY70040.1 hypothetical protein BCR38DRAFT_520903 [Pseudomassariella vexata]